MEEKKVTEIINYTDIYDISVEDFIKWLEKKFYVDIPTNLDTIEDMKKAGKLLGELSNAYVYLTVLLSYTRSFVRTEKRKGKEAKSSYEDMIDKREALDDMTSAIKLQYQAISRMITVKQEIQEELSMSSQKMYLK